MTFDDELATFDDGFAMTFDDELAKASGDALATVFEASSPQPQNAKAATSENPNKNLE